MLLWLWLVMINNKIVSELSALDNKRKEILIKNLNQSQRHKLLKCLKGKQIGDVTGQLILKKIEEAASASFDYTRKTDRKSIIAFIERNLEKLGGQLACSFGFLTVRKTQTLVSRLLRPKSKLSNGGLKEISLSNLKSIVSKEKISNPNKNIDLKTILEKQGYSPRITNLQFDNNENIFLNVSLKDLIFEECQFDWCHFAHSSLTNVHFISCSLANSSFSNSHINSCLFQDCLLQEAMVVAAEVKKTTFQNCSIIGSSFEDTQIIGSTFFATSLPATHFLDAAVEKSNFIKCNLKDTIFFDALDGFEVDEDSKKTAVVTGPTAAIIVDCESRGIATPKAYTKLNQASQMIPLRINLKPRKSTLEQVNQEIEATLKEIGSYDKEKPPIPQQLLKRIAEDPDNYPESIKILNKAKKLAAEVDSFFLPGGEDLPPKLYGQVEDKSTDWGNDYRRSILELSIIHQSFNKGIPLMATCRGFQMSNVYFGAQLLQDVKGHKGVQLFRLANDSYKGLYYNAIKNSILSAVFHHQAIPEKSGPTEHLDPSVIYQNLIKASELKYSGAVPMILLQFHPEFYKATTADTLTMEWIDVMVTAAMSESNEIFWKTLSDSAKAHRVKKLAQLKLKKSLSNKSCFLPYPLYL